jgi:hypothetical protein
MIVVPLIICVQEGAELGSRGQQPGVPGCGCAPGQLTLRHGRSVLGRKVCGFVRGTIIDHHHRPRGSRLAGNTA